MSSFKTFSGDWTVSWMQFATWHYWEAHSETVSVQVYGHANQPYGCAPLWPLQGSIAHSVLRQFAWLVHMCQGGHSQSHVDTSNVTSRAGALYNSHWPLPVWQVIGLLSVLVWCQLPWLAVYFLHTGDNLVFYAGCTQYGWEVTEGFSSYCMCGFIGRANSRCVWQWMWLMTTSVNTCPRVRDATSSVHVSIIFNSWN